MPTQRATNFQQPARIVSLVPSLTQTLCEFGLKEQIVGCTGFCIDPPDLRRLVTNCGGTKTPELEIIRNLRPTHILVNSEENTAEHIAVLREVAPVLETRPETVQDVAPMIEDMGRFLNCVDTAHTMAVRVEAALVELASSAASTSPPERHNRMLAMIWRTPWMIAGTDTYMSSLLEAAGFVNASRDLANPETRTRYPAVTINEIHDCHPDEIFLASEPWPFRKRDVEALMREFAEAGVAHPPRCSWIDGKLLTWFGALTADAAGALAAYRRGQPSEMIRPF